MPAPAVDGDAEAQMAAEGGDGKVAEEEKEGAGVLKGATSHTPKTLELQMWEVEPSRLVPPLLLTYRGTSRIRNRRPP